MLFNEIYEKQTGVAAVAGIEPDSLLDPLRERMKSAARFVFDEQAVAMAANVSLSKPSSIIACLPFVRLPAPLVWIEFANQHLREAMASLGSPNIRTARHVVDIERTGFLIWEEDGLLVMDHVHRDRLPTGNTTVTISNVRVAFDPDSKTTTHNVMASMSHLVKKIRKEEKGKLEKRSPDDRALELSGKIGKRLKEVDATDAEAIAAQQMSWRFGMAPHPDQEHLRKAMLTLISEVELQRVMAGQMEDAYLIFSTLILPALILLNCRNAVEKEFVPAPVKLNKQRERKGKAPIPEHNVVKLHLTPRKRRLYESMGLSTSATMGGVVIGHFKVRKSGIFWWNPHWRGGEGLSQPKTYVLTR